MAGQGLVSYALIPLLLGVVALVIYLFGVQAGLLPGWCCWLPLVLGVGIGALRWLVQSIARRSR
jgi:hypothetical protein